MAKKYSIVFDCDTKTTSYYEEDENGIVTEIDSIPEQPLVNEQILPTQDPLLGTN
jgi:hypothetical protein